MSELTLLVLRLGFLLVLWGFVFAVVYALRTDLFGQRVKRQPADAGTAAPDVVPAPAPTPLMAATQDDLLTTPVRKPRTPAASLPHHTPGASGAAASRLVITSGSKAGVELPLGTQPLTIGRSAESGLVIRDDYTSTHHARLMLMDGDWVIQDLDSTNGTFLDGIRVALPTRVPLDSPVRIGTTTFELRR